MEAKYTPGPWLVIGHSIYQIESIGGRQVLHAGNRVYGRGNKNEIEANIQVMGAAPQLAEACQQAEKLLTTIANKLGGMISGVDCNTLPVRRILEAALSKAGVA